MEQLQILTKLKELDNIKHIEQKTEEWLAERREIITASEAGYLLGICGTGTLINYLSNKIFPSSSQNNLRYMVSIQHGNIFEDVSRIIYETRNNITVQEYGLIKSPKTPILGASPDGIVNKTLYNAQNRLGRLVEIKNPYKFDDSNDIKPEYLIQIYQQQYVLELPFCDFIKTNIIGANASDDTIKNGFTPYNSLDQLLEDCLSNDEIILQNANIPQKNLNSKGMEKGILISYKDISGDIKVIIYPIVIEYKKEDILEWIKQEKQKLLSSGGINGNTIHIQYWYVAKYYEKTIEYDKELFENNYLPRLKLIWQLVEQLKNLHQKYDVNTMKKLINTKIKPFLDKPSKYYKDVKQFDAICKLYKDVLQLTLEYDNDNDIHIDNNDITGTLNKPTTNKSTTNDTIIQQSGGIETGIKIEKPKRKYNKKKVEIEIDF